MSESPHARVLAEVVTGLEALAQRVDQRLDDLELLCEHLRETKVDKTAVADQVLEQLRR
jgi:hypothetical protein